MSNWLLWLTAGKSAVTDTNRSVNSLAVATGEDSTAFMADRVWLDRGLMLFLVIGALARVIRYYLCFPLWDDESFLCVNFIGRSYAELLQPLDYHQVAPVLFLWIERAVVQIFGFNEYSLRLVPLVTSLGSLF